MPSPQMPFHPLAFSTSWHLDLTFDDASRGSDGGSELTRNALGARWVRESVARVREARATLDVPSVDRRLFRLGWHALKIKILNRVYLDLVWVLVT